MKGRTMFTFNYRDKKYTINDHENSDTERFHKEIFLDGIYNEALLGEVDTVVDIGANVGLFTILISPFAKNIYAVEANSENTEVLKDMLQVNNINNVTVDCLAIAGSNGERDLYSGRTNGGYSIVNSDDVVERVSAKTLTQYLTSKGIDSVDILKIDVESAEDEIFSAPDIDEALSKIKLILAEKHGNSETFSKKLEDAGFIVTLGNGSVVIAKRK